MQILDSIEANVLNDQASNEELTRWFNSFAAECTEITGIKPDVSFNAHAEDSELPEGLAISAESAAQCLLDYQRTGVFLRGVYQALTDAVQKSPTETINVLYAGCGPYASLLLPLLKLLDSDKYKFVLLDIHPASISAVEALLAHADLKHVDITFLVEDAAVYKGSQKFDVIIAEVLQKALEQEPQVAVTKNLVPLLKREGVFIPQSIRVQMVLGVFDHRLKPNFHKQKEKNALTYRPLHPFIELSIATLGIWHANGSHNKIDFNQFEIPESAHGKNHDVMMATEITVYGKHELKNSQSTLTLPAKFYDESPATVGACYQLNYEFGRYPKFTLKRLGKQKLPD